MIDKLREHTYISLKENLTKYGKCTLIRPTGFGKTGILTRLIKEYNCVNILFLYPRKVVKNAVLDFYYNKKENDGTIVNVEFLSYSKLSMFTKDGFGILKKKKIDIIICDEYHRLGGTKTNRNFHKILELFPKAWLVGGTATPNRPDSKNISREIFDNHFVEPYTLHDAIKDVVLKKPYYCFCMYNIIGSDKDAIVLEEKAKSYLKGVTNKKIRKETEDEIKSKLIEISNLQNMEVVIKDVCDEYVKDISYMKFIVFFSSLNHIQQKGKDVIKWFNDAYPNHTIKTLTVSSKTKETRRNVENLKDLRYRENRIDLIFSVNMLNEGYHIDDLTGIVMYRGTHSDIVYIQQLGRVLSSGSVNSGIVFDVVDNLHRKSLYSTMCNSRESLNQKIERVKCLEFLKRVRESIGKSLSDSEEKELLMLKRYIERGSSEEYLHCNELKPEDLNVIGRTASYNEFKNKVVTFPLVIGAKRAILEWLVRYNERNNTNLKLEDLTREFVLNQLPPENPPVKAFCKLVNMSEEDVFDLLGL